MLLLKRTFYFFALSLGLFSAFAHAQTFEAELQRIARLRQVFGDQIVDALTNVPPAQYKEARDQALALADKVGDNAFAQDDARAKLCADFEALGAACRDLSAQVSAADDESVGEPSDEFADDNRPSDPLSAVDKSENPAGDDEFYSDSDSDDEPIDRQVSSEGQSEIDPEL